MRSGAAIGVGIQVVVTCRNVTISAGHRMHVVVKMSRLEKYTERTVRYGVEFYHENNPRQSKLCERVTITGRGKGVRVRAESRGLTFDSALDTAIRKLESRLRDEHAKRRTHHGPRRRTSVAAATAPFAAPVSHDRNPG
jgi:ribosomal subunit interface protein